MQLTITRQNLAALINTVQGSISHRSTLPILSMFALRARDNLLRLTGTDLDLTIENTAACSVTHPGELCVPADKFKRIITALEGEEIELAIDPMYPTRLEIRCGASYFKLNGLPIEEFPPAPKLADPIAVTFPQPALRELLSLASFCISTDESRQVLCGALMEFSDNRLTVVATDGRRLTTVQANCALATAMTPIVPARAVRELERLLSAKEGDVTARFVPASHFAEFTFGDVQLITKLIDGNFPNYQQVIPATEGPGTALDRAALLGVLRRVSLMTSAKNNTGTLHFRNKSLTVAAHDNDTGDAQDSMLAPGRKELKIAFNLDYVIASLAAIGAIEDAPAEITFHAADELSPGVFTCPEKQFRCVIMPVRLS